MQNWLLYVVMDSTTGDDIPGGIGTIGIPHEYKEEFAFIFILGIIVGIIVSLFFSFIRKLIKENKEMEKNDKIAQNITYNADKSKQKDLLFILIVI